MNKTTLAAGWFLYLIPIGNDMKKLIVILLFFPITAFADSSFLYPAKYEVAEYKNCKLDEKYIGKINSQVFVPDMYKPFGSYGIIDKVDLNQDGVCEAIVSDPSLWKPREIRYQVVQVLHGDMKNIGSISSEYWFGESHNGYAQIFSKVDQSNEFRASISVNVSRFNGVEYEIDARSNSSYGAYTDLGLEYYKTGNYKDAEICFINDYRMNKEESLKSANNLAITWIKLGKYKDAQLLLEKHIQQNSEPNQLASAYFNLGLIYEAKNDIGNAVESFTKSNNIKKSPAKTRRINDLLSEVSTISSLFGPLSNPQTHPPFPDIQRYERKERFDQPVTPHAENYAIKNRFNPALFKELFVDGYPTNSCSPLSISSFVYNHSYYAPNNFFIFDALNFSFSGTGRELTAVLYNSEPVGERYNMYKCLQGWKLAVFEKSKIIEVIEIPFSIGNLFGSDNTLYTGLNIEKGRLKVVVDYVMNGSGGWPHEGFVHTLSAQNGALFIEKTERLDDHPNLGEVLCLEGRDCR